MGTIEQDIIDFLSVKSYMWYKFEVKENENDFLVWVSKKHAAKQEYTVYFKADYQFNLRHNNGTWEIQSVRVMSANPIEKTSSRAIINGLEETLKQN